MRFGIIASFHAVLINGFRSSNVLHFPPSSISLFATVSESPSSSSSDAPVFEPPDMEAYASGYRTVFEELPYQVCKPMLGEVPADLEGSYFRVGPAMFSAGSILPPKTSIIQPKQGPVLDGQDPNRMVRHPFDGDGAVLGVSFLNGEITARYRYIRTPGFTNERKKGARLYESMDSTRSTGACLGNDIPLPLFRHHLMPGLNKQRKHTANTRVFYWGKRLMALWEGGQPYKIDPLALQTEGRSRLGGAIPKDSDPFGSRMMYDSINDRAVFYAVKPEPKKSEISLYEFDGTFKLLGERSIVEVPGFAMLNDFAITQQYAIFVQPAMEVNTLKYLVAKEPGAVLTLCDDQAATVHLVSRTRRGVVKSFPVPVDSWSDGNLQFINAYEEGDCVIFDAIRSNPQSLDSSRSTTWPWGATVEEYRAMASQKSLWRYKVDTRSGVVEKKQLYTAHCMFGVVDPLVSSQKHSTIYMNIGAGGTAACPPQGIAALQVDSGDIRTWMPKNYEFLGEPTFAAGTESNYLLSVLFNGRQQSSEIVIFKAEQVEHGPLTRIPLNVTIPHGLFGCFTSTSFPFDMIQRRAKLLDKMESRGNMWNEVKSDFSGMGLRFDGTL